MDIKRPSNFSERNEKKCAAWPFQEGLLSDSRREVHLFTDYRWNDGSVSRRWHVDPEYYDAGLAVLRPVSLKESGAPGQ